MSLYSKFNRGSFKSLLHSNEHSRRICAKTDHKPMEKSLTHQSIKGPLKKARLSSPFPEPIKVVPYSVVSDMEKAQIMQDSVQLPQSVNNSDDK